MVIHRRQIEPVVGQISHQCSAYIESQNRSPRRIHLDYPAGIACKTSEAVVLLLVAATPGPVVVDKSRTGLREDAPTLSLMPDLGAEQSLNRWSAAVERQRKPAHLAVKEHVRGEPVAIRRSDTTAVLTASQTVALELRQAQAGVVDSGALSVRPPVTLAVACR